MPGYIFWRNPRINDGDPFSWSCVSDWVVITIGLCRTFRRDVRSCAWRESRHFWFVCVRLILGLCILIPILLFLNIYFMIKWQHPDDANNWVTCKLVVVTGSTLVQLVVVGLPLDVANNSGAMGCSYDWGVNSMRRTASSPADACVCVCVLTLARVSDSRRRREVPRHSKKTQMVCSFGARGRRSSAFPIGAAASTW